MRAWYGGYRLTRDFYKGDRAMRESGFDTSDRFGPSPAQPKTTRPGLNCLLYRYERDLEHFAHLLGLPMTPCSGTAAPRSRNAAIHRYLWRPGEGVFTDYDFVHSRKPSTYAFVTWLYPLWAGVATREEANRSKQTAPSSNALAARNQKQPQHGIAMG